MTASKANRWLVLLVVSSALFLIVVDMSVLHTALPTLTRELGASAAEKLWIMNAYALVVAGLLPGCGTLGDRVGHKRMFVAGLAVFGMASLVAAIPSPLLITDALLASARRVCAPCDRRLTFNDEERALAIGNGRGGVGRLGRGPLIGGLLLEYFWWGSVFLISVPVSGGALAAFVLFRHEQTRRGLGPPVAANPVGWSVLPAFGGGHAGAVLPAAAIAAVICLALGCSPGDRRAPLP